MKPTADTLSQQFIALIGREVFEQAVRARAAAEAAAKLAAEAAAKAAAEKVAAAKAAPAPDATPATAAKPGAALPVNPSAPVAARPPSSPVATPVATLAKPPGPAAPATATRPAPAAPAAAPVVTALPSLPVQTTVHAAKGCDFEATVPSARIVAAAEIMDRAGFAIDTITGVDWIAQNEMEVVYDFFHPTEPLRAVVRTRVPRPTPELPSIVAIFPGANWHEREAHDFFGLVFTGHPNLKPFLLPEDADFHPLRKDYQP